MSDHKKIERLEKRIDELEKLLGNKGKAIIQIQKEETTFKVSEAISKAYDAIQQAKDQAIRDKAPREVFDKLNTAKQQVPKKYAISKESMQELNDLLNSLAGVNTSQ